MADREYLHPEYREHHVMPTIARNAFLQHDYLRHFT